MVDKNEDSIEEILEELIEIPSIGELTARILVRNGFDSVSKLKDLETEDLLSIDEIGRTKAEKIIDEVNGNVEGSKSVTSEIFCVNCRIIVDADKDACDECEESFSLEGIVIIPDEGWIEEPKLFLADIEKDLMDGKESPKLWFGRGAILDSMGYKWEALRSYNKVIEQDPLFDNIWNAKARAALEVGQIKDAAKAYKVAFDTHVANIPTTDLSRKRTSMKREGPKIEERDVSVKEVENKLFMARSVVHELKGNEIDISPLNRLLDKAVEARNNDNRKEAISKAQNIISSAELLREFLDVKGDLEEVLEELSDLDIEVEEFVSEKESVIDDISEGDYEKAVDRSYEILEEVEDILEEEKRRLEEKREKEEKLNQGIEEIKKLMKELRVTSLKIEEFKKDFSQVVADKREERYVEGLDKVEDIKETGQTILETNDKLKELKRRVDESEFTLEEFGYKEDLQKILDLSRDGLYHEAMEKSTELLDSYDDRLEELKVEKELKDEFSKNVSELKGKFSELKDTSLNFELIKSMINNAKELKNEEEYEEGIDVLKEAIDNTDKLLDFSEDYEQAKELIKKANELNLDYEPFKERLKVIRKEAENGAFDDVFDDVDELIQEVETTLDEKIEEMSQRLADQITTLETVIEDGVDKDIQMDIYEKKLADAKEALEEEEYKKGLETLEDYIEEAEMKVQLEPMLDTVNEIIADIDEEVEVEEFEEGITDIRNEFDQGNYEESLKMTNDLHQAILARKDEWEEEQRMKEEFGEKLPLAKEKLSECQNTKINVDDVKEMINEAVAAEEESDYEKALTKVDKAIDTADRVLDIYGLIKEGAEKINKFKEYELDYKEYLEHLKDCRKMADVNIYDKAEMLLEDALDDMDEELIEIGEETLEEVAEESKDELEAMEEELSRSYERLRQDVKDLKGLYSLADEFDIQVGIGRKLLKITIKNIREGDYKKAIKHIESSENRVIEAIEERIDDTIYHVESKLTRVEDEERLEKAEELMDEIEDGRQNGEYQESLEKLQSMKEMLEDIREFDIDEKISSLEELVEDADEAGIDVEEPIDLIEKVREMEESQEDGLEEEVESTEEEIRDLINADIKNKIEKEREEMEEMEIDESLKSKPLNLLTNASKAQGEDDLKKAISFIIDYQEMLEEGLEESED